MTHVAAPEPVSTPRVRAGAVILTLLSAGLAFFVVTISYGLAREYGDTAAPDARIAAQSFRDWGIGLVMVAGLAVAVVAAARRSCGQRVMTLAAASAVLVTTVGVPAGAVVGVHQKAAAYPVVPSCTSGFASGPAVPVVRAAQAAYAELDHPGPFSGGGSSGVDGCSTQLMVDEGADVPVLYREALVDAGWRVTRERPDLIVATKDGQGFEASRDPDGSWWVWIGPADLQVRPGPPGEVSPRR